MTEETRSVDVRALVTRFALPVGLVVLLACLPLLNLSLPGVLPGPTYTPGSLHLMALAMVMAALALSYHLLFGVAGLLSFGHALHFGAGAYGLGILMGELREPRSRFVALCGGVIALALVPFTPPGVPILAAAVAALLGLRK